MQNTQKCIIEVVKCGCQILIIQGCYFSFDADVDVVVVVLITVVVVVVVVVAAVVAEYVVVKVAMEYRSNGSSYSKTESYMVVICEDM